MRSDRGWSGFPARLHRLSRCATSNPRRRGGSRPAPASSTGCWAAGWSPARWCWSAASPASARARCCCRRWARSRRRRQGAAGQRRGVAGAGAPARRAARRRRRHLDPAETELETVCEVIRREKPDVCVVDSVQTLFSSDLSSAPGSVAQVREAADRLARLAKREGVTVVLVGHVTKEGDGRRAARARAPGRRGAAVRGRPLPLPARAAGGRRTGSARPTRSASSR